MELKITMNSDQIMQACRQQVMDSFKGLNVTLTGRPSLELNANGDVVFEVDAEMLGKNRDKAA